MEHGCLGNAIIVRHGAALTASNRVALLASYSSGGAIKKHVEYYSKRLSECGFRVVLVIACDHLEDLNEVADQETSADYVIRRDNRGFDFGSWSHAFKLFPALFDARSCLLTNDSLFGPFKTFDAVMARLFSIEGNFDLVSLTDNYEGMHHFQSYFMHISNQLLTSSCFRLFIDSIRPFETKSQIINLYEIPMTRFIGKSGFRAGALFSTPDLKATEEFNATLCAWRELVQQGFPFVKIELLRDNPFNADIADWENILTDSGYNPKMALDHLETFSAARTQA